MMLDYLAITGTAALVGGGGALAGWIIWAGRTPIDAPEPWTPGELTALPPAQLRFGQQATERCEQCRGRRCWYHRNGMDCPKPVAPKLTQTLGGNGLHEPARTLGRIVPGNWSPLPASLRVFLAPSVHTPATNGHRKVVRLP